VQWFEKLAEAVGPDFAQVVDTKRNVAVGVAKGGRGADIAGPFALR
jgi:hypothetical protein